MHDFYNAHQEDILGYSKILSLNMNAYHQSQICQMAAVTFASLQATLKNQAPSLPMLYGCGLTWNGWNHKQKCWE